MHFSIQKVGANPETRQNCGGMPLQLPYRRHCWGGVPDCVHALLELIGQEEITVLRSRQVGSGRVSVT